jgi:glutamyl-tRNA synthetase
LSFVLTAGLARKYDASILLRIDDMDHDRVRKDYIDDIFETLRFLNIPWDEGPRSTEEHLHFFSQKLRLKIYQDALNTLASKNMLFACSCSRADLELLGNHNGYSGTCLEKNIPLDEINVQWRMKTSILQEIHLTDLLNGDIKTVLPATMKYFQVRKKNGDPAYQICSLMDDMHLGVDLIVRGEDLWNSTLAQISLSEALETQQFSKAHFLHHPLLKNEENEKLSKSAGDTSIHFLRKKGYTPGEIWEILANRLNLMEKPHNWQEMYQLVSQNWLKLP